MFIAHIIQEGEGCDNTISRGETLIRLNAGNKEDAIIELKQKIIGTESIYIEGVLFSLCEFTYDGIRLKKVTLFEILEETNITIDTWNKEIEDFEKEKKRKAEKTQRKEQYEKLKAEFG